MGNLSSHKRNVLVGNISDYLSSHKSQYALALSMETVRLYDCFKQLQEDEKESREQFIGLLIDITATFIPVLGPKLIGSLKELVTDYKCDGLMKLLGKFDPEKPEDIGAFAEFLIGGASEAFKYDARKRAFGDHPLPQGFENSTAFLAYLQVIFNAYLDEYMNRIRMAAAEDAVKPISDEELLAQRTRWKKPVSSIEYQAGIRRDLAEYQRIIAPFYGPKRIGETRSIGLMSVTDGADAFKSGRYAPMIFYQNSSEQQTIDPLSLSRPISFIEMRFLAYAIAVAEKNGIPVELKKLHWSMKHSASLKTQAYIYIKVQRVTQGSGHIQVFLNAKSPSKRNMVFERISPLE